MVKYYVIFDNFWVDVVVLNYLNGIFVCFGGCFDLWVEFVSLFKDWGWVLVVDWEWEYCCVCVFDDFCEVCCVCFGEFVDCLFLVIYEEYVVVLMDVLFDESECVSWDVLVFIDEDLVECEGCVVVYCWELYYICEVNFVYDVFVS